MTDVIGSPRAVATSAAIEAVPTTADARRTANTAKPSRGLPYDLLVVGAGFAGAVMAERAASAGQRVLVIDRRDHIAGNAFDELDDDGILIHRYGPHLFHTNSPQVSDYLSRFTAWHSYEHRVRAQVGDQLVPMPINRDTVNALHGLELHGGADVEKYLRSLATTGGDPRNSEEAVVGQVGRDLYERLFKGYTRKQWALDPSELDASVCARIPVRFDDDDRYFTDSFQRMPLDGYTAMFERMLDHPRIERQLHVDFESIRESAHYRKLVWTGPIDQYFGHSFGELPYRSLRFDRHSLPTPTGGLHQPVGQVNYPAEQVPYTRSCEYRHFTGQRAQTTSIIYEYPTADGDPYYPIPAPQNELSYRRYAALAAATRDVVFVGRLASYRYMNMDQVVAQALDFASRYIEGAGLSARPARLAAGL